MPRRNRNASTVPVSADTLADQIAHLTAELQIPAVTCAACRVNPATTGDYCVLCKGSIILAARRDTLARR